MGRSQQGFVVVLLFGAITGTGTGAAVEDEMDRMLREVELTLRQTRDYTGFDHFAPRVLDAMRRVPRHEFVPPAWRSSAYLNQPLPIGNGQTISQPYIVALMTELANLDDDDIVLEVGTGSGYQAAILAELGRHVYTVEIDAELGRRAGQTLDRLGYANVTVRIGDGYHGWAEAAPFDAILVTAAPAEVPAPLLHQLKPGGRMVIPVGAQTGAQTLKVITRAGDDDFRTRNVLPVGFVPLTGEH